MFPKELSLLAWETQPVFSNPGIGSSWRFLLSFVLFIKTKHLQTSVLSLLAQEGTTSSLLSLCVDPVNLKPFLLDINLASKPFCVHVVEERTCCLAIRMWKPCCKLCFVASALLVSRPILLHVSRACRMG